jgi:hypothetical protein
MTDKPLAPAISTEAGRGVSPATVPRQLAVTVIVACAMFMQNLDFQAITHIVMDLGSTDAGIVDGAILASLNDIAR